MNGREWGSTHKKGIENTVEHETYQCLMPTTGSELVLLLQGFMDILATSHNILEVGARVPARRPELGPGSPSSSGARISNG